MPTSYRKFPVDLRKGIDSKQDPKVVEGQLLTLENGSMDAVGAIKKRYGSVQASKNIHTSIPLFNALGGTGTLQDTTPIDKVVSLVSLDDTLLAHSGKRIYEYLKEYNKWKDVGPCSAFDIEYNQIVRDKGLNYTFNGFDVAEIGNILCVCWSDYRATDSWVNYILYDREADAVLAPPYRIDLSLLTSPLCPRVVALDSYFYMAYIDLVGGNRLLRLARIDSTDSSAAPTLVTVAGAPTAFPAPQTTANEDNYFDMKSLLELGYYQVAIGYVEEATQDAILLTVDVATMTGITSAAYNGANMRGVSLGVLSGKYSTNPVNDAICMVAPVDASVNIYCEFYQYNGAVLAASGAGANIINTGDPDTLIARFCEVVENPNGTANSVVVAYPGRINALVSGTYTFRSNYTAILQATVNYGAPSITVGAPLILQYCNLGSSLLVDEDTRSMYAICLFDVPFTVYDSAGAGTTSYPVRTVTECFLVELTCVSATTAAFNPTAVFLKDSIGNVGNFNRHSSLIRLGDNSLCYAQPVLYPNAFDLDITAAWTAREDKIYREHGVIIKFVPDAALSYGKLNDCFYISTQCLLWHYDKAQIYEHGLFGQQNFWGGLVLTSGYTTGGIGNFGSAAAVTNYFIAVCFSYYDGMGNRYYGPVHYNASPITVPILAAVDAELFAYVPVPILTRKEFTVTCHLFATVDSGEVYYEVGVTDVEINAAALTWLVQVTSGAQSPTGNPSILDNKQLYTTGGVVENSIASAPTTLLNKGDRLLSSSKDWYLYYSKDAVRGESLGIAEEFKKPLPSGKSQYVSLGELSSTTVVFCESGIYYFSGDGPAVTGVGDDFSLYRKVNTSVSWVPRTPVLSLPEGILFIGNNGVNILTPGFTTQFIGAQISSIDVSRCTSIVSDSENSRVFFALGQAGVLMYDTLLSQWSVYNAEETYCVAWWNGRLVRGCSSGRVYIEDSSIYQDAEKPYSMKLGTSWMKPDGMTGWWRLRNFAALIERKTDCKVKVKLYYDYEDKVVQEFTYDTKVKMKPDETTVTVRFYPSRHKCTAFRLEIYDEDAVGTGEGFALIGLEIEAGQIGGLSRTSTRKMKG
jgi:hypothetical protein